MNLSEFNVENRTALNTLTQERENAPLTINPDSSQNNTLTESARLIKRSLLNEDAKNIKNVNELFAEFKKSDKALRKMITLMDDAKYDEVITVIQETLYKEKPLFQNMKQDLAGNKVSNLYLELRLLFSERDYIWAREIIENQLEITSALLEEVKKMLLSQSNAMGKRVESSLNMVKEEIGNLTQSEKSLDVDQLKNRFKSLFN